jgi:predicted dehydrogenase
MGKKVRMAIIGSGGISHAHARGMIEHKDKVECVALCDVSEANLKTRNEQLGGNLALFQDWKKMLAEMGDKIDAVVICLPHHLHAPAILDSVAAGKHVLCEKPMCIELAEADRIVEAVNKKGITYMSAHCQLFAPNIREIKARIEAGELGKVRWIRVSECFLASPNSFAGQWRAELKYQGGGELIDTGYHPAYQLYYLGGGEIAAIRGTMGRFEHAIEGEDTASVQVRFKNGVIGEILTSWAFARPHGVHNLHLIGDKGELFGSGHLLYHLPRGEKTPVEIVLPETDQFLAQMSSFADCVVNGTRPIHGAEEGRDVLKIILEASRNAEGWQQTASITVKTK